MLATTPGRRRPPKDRSLTTPQASRLRPRLSTHLPESNPLRNDALYYERNYRRTFDVTPAEHAARVMMLGYRPSQFQRLRRAVHPVGPSRVPGSIPRIWREAFLLPGAGGPGSFQPGEAGPGG